MTISISKPWTRQPLGENYLLNAAYDKPFAFWNLVDGANSNIGRGIHTPTSNNIGAFQSTESGIGRRFTAANLYACSWPLVNTLTMMAVVKAEPSTTRSAAISVSGGTGGGAQHYILLNTASNYSASSGSVAVGGGSTPGNASLTASAGVIDRLEKCIVYTFDNVTKKLFVGGRLLNSAPNTYTEPSSASYFFGINGINGYTGYTNTNNVLLMLAVWDKCIPDSHAIMLSRNPWSLFAPRRIIWPYTASGATAPTLGTASAINITATGATPQLTATW